MASTIPLQILDDDDEYDWDAAVREIDAACEKKINKPSSSSSAAATATATATGTISFQNTNSYMGSCPKIENNKPNSSRQSTLDNVFDLRATAATATSTISFQNTNLHMGSCPKIENNKPNSSRQSTLDKFIGRTESKSINQNVRHDVEDTDLCDDERVSSVSIDTEAAKTWIYPENVTVRDYQLSITKTALFSNTLVSLPTGLGKTLIAAVVMYNYYRWFPEGKIVFAAPSRPLVMQQIEACHNIVGIPQEYTVDMTGQTSPSKRASLWISKRIFFVTPQVLEKDIQSGSCTVKQLVCLVIDEAHRASGNYSYCVVVRELMAVSVQLRILALTATPGSDHQTVQQVIDNLQISSLEFRSESDPEVIPFVYDKKIELIKVEMGNDAVEVNNLLMDVISPFTQKLSSMGLLPKRDPRTFSQCDFLNSREAFRQTPRHDLSHMKDKIEGMYAVLLTLYHMRKLLSVHGIHSAFEMLEDKLKQRSFASLMSRNENLWKVKVKMQENISHGALSPKFSKMLEVLVEHFKKNDPQKSRVMIFSNYRNSVRDIMSSVATIGAYVKATEFIGQNSGKTSKGQSQKVQQAVLEKFRAGGYNVIVATSIGEEGLDIMEVDLVICFDSNISPVRMIQRMGRTGRKSKGRVVFLAYEGSEARGYKNKQGKSKNLEKLMINGGTSFHFHSSPRMVPHVFRPEKVFVKFVIEQFIPRGKKLKEDNTIQTPRYKLELTEFESDMLANYFDPLKEDDWRPSLIAFPHFQAFRSRVHKVSHSTRTCMLIDTMQCLQGLSFSNHSKSLYGQDKETSEECFRVETIEHHDDNTREEDLTRKEPDDILSQHPPSHSFLFGLDFTSVDSLGRVLILSVPSFPLKKASPIKISSPPNTKPVFLNCSKSDSSHLKASHKEHSEIASVADCVFCDLATSPDTVFHTDNVNLEVVNREFSTKESSSADVDTGSVDELSIDSKAADLSPRLTNFLMSGVVPESPIDNGTSSQAKDYCTTPDLNMQPDTSISLVQIKNDEGIENKTPNRSMPREIQTLQNELRNSSSDKRVSSSKIVGEIRTPLTNMSNKSGSKDWILSSGEKSISQPKQRLKRLRRYADIKSGSLLENKEIVRHSSVSGRSRAQFYHPFDKHSRGNERLLNEAKVFIEDEAEVSSEASGDEEIDIEQDSYGGSFIDDRINPTMASTQAETAQCDMMAIYRRSLLSQSPIVNQSPENIVSIDQTHDYGDSVIATTTDEIRKRKLSSSEGGSLPICNLENEIFSKQDAALQMDEFDNDDFFEDIDLDALEEQAAKQLRSKSEMLNEKTNDENLGFLDCPSFDLGI